MISALSKLLAFAPNAKDTVVCDTVTPMAAPFDASRYMGLWYEHMHTANQPFQKDTAICTTAEYTDLTDEGHFKVYNSNKNGKHTWIPRTGIHGDAKCPSDEGSGQCFVKFFAPFTRWADEPNYHIVDTDYDTYSIVYNCDETDMQYLWILTRTPTIDDDLSDMLVSKAFAALPNYTTS